jgi:hypothetical protein
MSFSPYRGLFFLSPFLLLAVPGFWLWAKRGGREWLLFLVVSILYFLLLSSFATWWGGWAAGPRYIIPIFLFLAFPIIFVLDWVSTLSNRDVIRYVVYGSMVISVVSVWAETITNASWPNDWTLNPLFDLCLPALVRGDLSPNRGIMVFGLNGLESLLPLAVALVLWSFGAFGPTVMGRFRAGHGFTNERWFMRTRATVGRN